jgi:hypothetical protein
MKFKIFITALVLSLALPAAAQFELITKGAEVVLSDLRLPRNDGGTIAYKPCRTCDYKTNRVAVDARYEIDGKAMQLSAFRKQLSLVRDRKNQSVTVVRHLESNLVTRVSIYIIRSAE